MTVPADVDTKDLEAAALADERVKELVGDKKVRKVIAVPGRLVNIVVGSTPHALAGRAWPDGRSQAAMILDKRHSGYNNSDTLNVSPFGEVAERLKAADLKSAEPFGVPGVRIPPSPFCRVLREY